MSVLVDHEIKRFIESGDIIVDPFDESLINPASLDIRLGGTITTTVPRNEDFIIDPLDKSTWVDKSWDITDGSFLLAGGEFILASMLEKTKLPSWITAKLMGKSSLGRLQITNSSMAGLIDAGWGLKGEGTVLTMELVNHSRYPIRLTYGMKIGQLVFFSHSDVEKDYSVRGRYNTQKPGAGSHGV